ncbi:MAG: hypothetical protein KBE22_15865 [Candidatus Accumulibacter sp.]|nr:hypothetical protein [Accumulibacter sp.]
MSYLPPEWMHNLLPADAQMTLRDAHQRLNELRRSPSERAAIIETAERRVRAMCPDAYRGDE